MFSEQTIKTIDLDSKALRDKLSLFAKREGIRQWDLGAACSKDCSVQVDRGEAKQLKGAQRSSITVRVWNEQGLVGITSTSDLSDTGLQKALIGAYRASDFGNVNDIPAFSSLATAPLPNLDRQLRPAQGIKRLLELLKQAEAELLERHTAIQTIPYNGLAESISKRIYLNSDGALRQIDCTNASIYLYARAEESGRKPRSGGAVRLALGSQDLDIDGCIDEAAELTISHLNYAPIDTGRYLVCFTPDAFLDLIGAFSSMFNARAILDGVSLSQRDSLGSKIAVPFFCLHDNGLHPANIGATSFDGEGTPTRKLCLINEGKLDNLLHSEATARAFGVEPTGHAGLGAKVSVGPDWFEVSSTETLNTTNNHLHHNSFAETFVLIEGLNALHAGVKPSQGSFSLPFSGWIINQGEKVSIEAATVAGDIRTLFNSIEHMEAEQVITHNGASPHVWVNGLSISGEA